MSKRIDYRARPIAIGLREARHCRADQLRIERPSSQSRALLRDKFDTCYESEMQPARRRPI